MWYSQGRIEFSSEGKAALIKNGAGTIVKPWLAYASRGVASGAEW
jgi:hypothetical protein